MKLLKIILSCVLILSLAVGMFAICGAAAADDGDPSTDVILTENDEGADGEEEAPASFLAGVKDKFVSAFDAIADVISSTFVAILFFFDGLIHG